MPKWEERDQEDFQRHHTLGLQGERFTTNETLQTILGIVDAFEKASGPAQYRAEARRMEKWILEMEDVTLAGDEQQGVASTQIVPRLTQFLSPQNQAVRRRGELPGYIEEELTVLQRKWGRGDFLGAIRRGIVAVDTFDRNGIRRSIRYELDRTYGFLVDAKYFGAGDLVNGQIWMSRLELRRDGVHAPPIAGISGTIAGGARSIVLGEFDESKNKGYADIDMGEVIEYMGTALPDKADSGETNTEDPHMHNPGSWNPVRDPTAATQAMMRSFDTQIPVRVIRSCNMHSIVSNKPSKGYRYDGLYKVVGKTPMKEERQIWSFRLQRLHDQGYLRGFQRGEPQPDSSGRRRGHYYQGR
ncbi:hypothetical protein LTR64_001126 [Lithohypha guttulata]|uniref:uncharacterized protein n=1 Tax=Lithohypha guttulata TaxID=1690604 RepID=UPI002DDFA7BB|nr:hypothetical protein LTR51_003320 [Lithohypha guttulata]